MQKIIHSQDYRSIHPIINELEQFYALTSEKTLQSQTALFKPTFDNAFGYLQSLFNQYGDTVCDFDLVQKNYPTLDIPKKRNTVIVCFSGGKDSTATAVYYKNLGYDVYLYHVKAINKSYPDEWKRAQDVADYLELPIYFDTYELKGQLGFIEHPMKNMIIANGALQWAVHNNLGYNIAVGNYLTGGLNSSMFYICGDDSPQLWDAYELILRKAIPDFRVSIVLKNHGDTLDILSSDIKLFELCQSCIGAQRFRKWNHDNNEKKYGIKLLKHRCGSCWKCCVEYIYLADHDKVEYNEPYYIHCLDVLKKSDLRENGVIFSTVENLWDGYFQYDISKSKYKNILKYGRRGNK